MRSNSLSSAPGAAGIAGPFFHHWMFLAFALVACFINGIIATKLPKNAKKSFRQLSKGSLTSDPISLEKSRFGIVDTSGATSALVRSAYLCAAFACAVSWNLEQGWWKTALITIGVFFFIMLLGSTVIRAHSAKDNGQ
jgi:N-acyl-L-homoserine lactone synthetase